LPATQEFDHNKFVMTKMNIEYIGLKIRTAFMNSRKANWKNALRRIIHLSAQIFLLKKIWQALNCNRIFI